MLDSGSMACSMSSRLLPKLQDAGVISPHSVAPTSVVLIGCGGLRTCPVGVCELQMKVHDCQISVPTLVVDGQSDDLILGSNVIKHLIRMAKHPGSFGETASLSPQASGKEDGLLQLLATVEKWRGSEIPEKVGTVKLKHAVTLEPMREHLVWGRLPGHVCLCWKHTGSGTKSVTNSATDRHGRATGDATMGRWLGPSENYQPLQ